MVNRFGPVSSVSELRLGSVNHDWKWIDEWGLASPSAGGVDFGDVDFAPLHHRFEGAFGFRGKALQTGVPVLFEVEHAAHGDDSGGFIPNEIDRVGETFGGCETVGTKTFTEELGRLGDHRELHIDPVHEVFTSLTLYEGNAKGLWAGVALGGTGLWPASTSVALAERPFTLPLARLI